ncbi:MAG: hypothetical protein A3H49_03995 [Nitrospirae bacterium RIFCSPLOWO2_02_FULL_62_14]|nr:MAG: hypothetical protein A3H49_03995 [Nitrospirae bacterium RIFCSPLOWO2_02_FULL_62_14]
MKYAIRIKASVAVLVTLAIVTPFVSAADLSQDQVVRYLLATAKAFRSVYAKDIVEEAKRGGVKPAENWKDNEHAIMLPAQFIKAAGAEIKDFELSLIGLTPIYKSNLPKTKAEADALKKLAAQPDLKVVTFADGDQFKGLSADFAIAQGCADCHNTHPSSPKKDFKKGDLMGAVVVRLHK